MRWHDVTHHPALLGRGETYISTQPRSPLISTALMCSPAERYISTAALGSLMFRAQSACLVISILVSLGSPDPRKSCGSKANRSALVRTSRANIRRGGQEAGGAQSMMDLGAVPRVPGDTKLQATHRCFWGNHGPWCFLPSSAEWCSDQVFTPLLWM